MENIKQKKREIPSPEDVERLSELFEKVTLTPSGMLRVMTYLVENPDMAKRSEREIKAMQDLAEAIKLQATTQGETNRLFLEQFKQVNISFAKIASQ